MTPLTTAAITIAFVVLLLLALARGILYANRKCAELEVPRLRADYEPEDICADRGHDMAPLHGGGRVCLRCCRVWEDGQSLTG